MTDMLNEHLKKLEPYRQRICSGILPHYIGGAPDPGSSGRTFENLTPVDNSKLCDVARGTAGEIGKAAEAAEAAFADWRKASGKARKQILHKIADLIVGAPRGDRPARMPRYRPGNPLHEGGGRTLGGQLPIFRRPRARSGRRPGAAVRRAYELYDAAADRPGRRHHAVEHTVHAVDLEDRAGPRGGLHGRPQAGGMEPADRHHPGRNQPGSRPARRRAQFGARPRRGCGRRTYRARGNQGGRLRRRIVDRLEDHGPGRADAEARAFRTGRQESGDRVRRCRPRPGAGCRLSS